MAELASGIVTLTQVSLMLIKETALFIQEARDVDTLVDRLLDSLLQLRKLIKTVESTCRQATTSEDDPSRFVKESLVRCRNRLKEVDAMVRDLASRKTGNFLQKVALKIRSDRSKKEMEDAIQDVERLMDHIHKGISLWTLHMTSAIDRRTSGAVPVQQVSSIRNGLQQLAGPEHTGPLTRTFTGDTILDDELSVHSRRTSSTTQFSRNSISSTSSRAQPTPGGNTVPEAERTKESSDYSDSVDFHYQVKVCDGDEARVRAITAALREHPEGSKLANSKDVSKRSPLHLAAQRGDVKVAEILLKFKADINAKDSQPCSVLDLAVANNREDFVGFLLEHNVDDATISKQNRDRFEEIKEAIELRKPKPEKPARKSRKRTRSAMAI